MLVPDVSVDRIRRRVGDGVRVPPYRVGVEDDLLRVVHVGTSRWRSRPAWVGTMTDTDGGVLLSGRVRDRMHAFASACLSVVVLFLVALSALALLGDDAGFGAAMLVLAGALAGLGWWHARAGRRVAEAHARDVGWVLDRLLSDRRRPATQR